MTASPVSIEAHAFAPRDFIAGDAALDFINTVTGRDQTPRDWLDSYARLIEWARQTELLPADVLHRLAAEAKRRPQAALAALKRARQLREALFEIMSRIAAGQPPSTTSLALLKEQWVAGARLHEFAFDDGRFIAAPCGSSAGLDSIGAMVAYGLVERVLAAPLERLRMCAGENCSWLFIDKSKSGGRRWCDMATCGNVAKSRRHYSRTRRRAGSYA